MEGMVKLRKNMKIPKDVNVILNCSRNYTLQMRVLGVQTQTHA